MIVTTFDGRNVRIKSMGMVRIKDIAEKAGVSPTTVSNVIHGNTKKVSKDTIANIQKLLESTSYVPSMGARMLAENRSRIIGVLLGGKADKRRSAQGDAFANIMISALEYEIFRRNYFMMLHLSSSPEENLQLAATWNVEGLIMIGLSMQDNIKLQRKSRVPVVSIDAYYENQDVPNIGLDDFRGGYEMGRHLIDKGHRDIVFLADNDVGVDHFRWLGLQQALRDAGVASGDGQHMLLPEDVDLRMEFYERKAEVLSKHDALFFASDYYALEAVNYLQNKGLHIPRDISVCGFDDSEYALLARPHLTTVHQDVRQKGVAAVQMLFDFIEGQKVTVMNEKLPIYVVERDSVAVRN